MAIDPIGMAEMILVERHDGGRRAKITLMPSLPNMHYKKFPHWLHILVWLTQPHATILCENSQQNIDGLQMSS